MEILSVILSVTAIIVSALTFIINYKSIRKTQQMKTAMEISYRLNDIENKIFLIEDEINKIEYKDKVINADELVIPERQLRDSYLEHLC
jgi:hypothetical protein